MSSTVSDSHDEESLKSSQSIFDNCQYVKHFHHHLKNFLLKLRSIMPDDTTKSTTTNVWKHYRSTDRKVYLKQVYGMITPHILEIEKYNEGIMGREYCEGPLYVLPEFDIKALFQSFDKIYGSSKSDIVKKRNIIISSIFDYIHTLYINAGQALEQIGELGSNVKKFQSILANMFKNIKSEKLIKQRMDEMEDEDEENIEDSINKIKDMIGEDSAISGLIEDIVKELGISDYDNPLDMITSLFDGDGSKITKLIQSIGEKIHAKIESGELSFDQLKKDAVKLQSSLVKNTKFIDIFKDMGISEDQIKGMNEILEKSPEDMTEHDREHVKNILSELETHDPTKFEELHKMLDINGEISKDLNELGEESLNVTDTKPPKRNSKRNKKSNRRRKKND